VSLSRWLIRSAVLVNFSDRNGSRAPFRAIRGVVGCRFAISNARPQVAFVVKRAVAEGGRGGVAVTDITTLTTQACAFGPRTVSTASPIVDPRCRAKIGGFPTGIGPVRSGGIPSRHRNDNVPVEARRPGYCRADAAVRAIRRGEIHKRSRLQIRFCVQIDAALPTTRPSCRTFFIPRNRRVPRCDR